MPLIQERAKNTSEERFFYTARVHARKPDTQVMQTDNVTESLKRGTETAYFAVEGDAFWEQFSIIMSIQSTNVKLLCVL